MCCGSFWSLDSISTTHLAVAEGRSLLGSKDSDSYKKKKTTPFVPDICLEFILISVSSR